MIIKEGINMAAKPKHVGPIRPPHWTQLPVGGRPPPPPAYDAALVLSLTEALHRLEGEVDILETSKAEWEEYGQESSDYADAYEQLAQEWEDHGKAEQGWAAAATGALRRNLGRVEGVAVHERAFAEREERKARDEMAYAFRVKSIMSSERRRWDIDLAKWAAEKRQWGEEKSKMEEDMEKERADFRAAQARWFTERERLTKIIDDHLETEPMGRRITVLDRGPQ